MKALQQRIVQVTRDAGRFAHALFQPHVELPHDLPLAQPIERAEQRQEGGHNGQTEPQSLVVRRGIEKPSDAPASFHTPLLLLAITRKR